MDFNKIISLIKLQKVTELSVLEIQEMTAFYFVLLKIQEKRVGFDVGLVMREVYTKTVFEKFIFQYKKA